MFHAIYTRKLLQISCIKDSRITPNAYFIFLHEPSYIKSISSISNPITKEQSSFTISYLMNSCGLSPESALSASKKIQLKTPENPDSVLTLFKNHGFSMTHISNIITKHPSLLLANPEKSIKPKIDFFKESGISGSALIDILSSNPALLKRSITNRIIPSFNFLKSCFPTNEKFIAALCRSTQLLQYNLQEAVVPNISILRKHGVPDSWISKEIMVHPRTFSHVPDRFNEIVKEIDEMGFDRSSFLFMLAVRNMVSMSKSKWEGKLDIYRSLGGSNDEILSAFKKQPFCMALSEKNLRRTVDFFTNEMGMKASTIFQCPNILLLSLENRIVPRCTVIRVLVSRSLIKKKFSLSTVLQCTESSFLTNFVMKYQEEVPDLLIAYQGKRDFVGLDLGPEEVCGTLKL